MAEPSACCMVMLVCTDVFADGRVIQCSENEESGSLIDDDLSTVLPAMKASRLMRKSKSLSFILTMLWITFVRTSNKAVLQINVVVFVAYSCRFRGGTHYYLLLEPRVLDLGLSDAVFSQIPK